MGLAPQLRAAAVAILRDGIGRTNQLRAFGSFDSSNVVTPRITDYNQRVGNNEGDLEGKIYNSNGGAVALVSVEYSQISMSGPWLPLTVLAGDPAYNFPSPGAPAGTPFNIPIEITDAYTGNVWFKITVSSPLPNSEHAHGSYPFIYVSPLPHLPSSIEVPEESTTGDYSVTWEPAVDADYYELEEDTDPAFGSSVLVYTGVLRKFSTEDRDLGTYYYRVRGVNVYGNGAWLEGSNGVNVVPLNAPGALGVPLENFTGFFKLIWSPVEGAEAYEVEEDRSAEFSQPRKIYDGSETECNVLKKESGAFHYRVRARRGT